MRGFFEKMAWKMERWMQGRNGLDDLARHLYYVGFVLLLLSLFDPSGLINLLAMVAIVYAMFRAFSKKLDKRQAENAAYLRKTAGIRTFFQQRKLRFDERKTYRFVKCKCGTTLRMRRGQGVREVVCPKCGNHLTCDTK